MEVSMKINMLLIVSATSFLMNCISGPVTDAKDLPSNMEKLDEKSKFSIPVTWFWRKSPSEENKVMYSSNLIDEESLEATNGEKGVVIGKIPPTEDAGGFFVIHFREAYWFARVRDIGFYVQAGRFILPESQQSIIRAYFMSFGNRPATGTPIVGMQCHDAWSPAESYRIYSKQMRFSPQFQAQVGDYVFVGNMPNLDMIVKFWPEETMPRGIFLCGIPKGKQALETQSGLLRNFEIVEAKYALIDWGNWKLAVPAQ